MYRFIPLLACLAVSACGTSTPVVAPPTDPTPEPSPEPLPEAAPVCLPADGYGLPSWLDGREVEVCVSSNEAVCLGYDLDTGTVTRRTPPSDEALTARLARQGFEILDAELIAQNKNTHTLCAPSGSPCKDIQLGKGRANWRSQNADKSLTVYSMGPTDADFSHIASHNFLVFETATGKLIKKHTFRDASLRCGGAYFVDNFLVVAVDVCAGPGGNTWFLDPKSGKKIDEIGGENQFGAYHPEVWVLDDKILFLEQTGTRFAIHDRKSGKFQRIVDLSPDDELVQKTDPYGNQLWVLPDGDALITLTGESTGLMLRVDSQSLVVEQRITIPRCKSAE